MTAKIIFHFDNYCYKEIVVALMEIYIMVVKEYFNLPTLSETTTPKPGPWTSLLQDNSWFSPGTDEEQMTVTMSPSVTSSISGVLNVNSMAKNHNLLLHRCNIIPQFRWFTHVASNA